MHQQALEQTLQTTSTESSFVLEAPVTIRASRAGKTVLKQGTRWQLVGSIEQGSVYRTKDQVVIVNSFNVHEGDIVVSSGMVVGYYLPTEKTFVDAKSVAISLVPMDP